MIEVLTIGAYGHSFDSFFAQLKIHQVDLLVDVRQRRGMRGSTYAFLNATALQSELGRVGIAYCHLKELAPSSDVRDAQRAADKELGSTKRSREGLSELFEAKYLSDVLNKVDLTAVLKKFGSHRRVCFFCVERTANACHRSLVASWLSGQIGVPITDISV